MHRRETLDRLGRLATVGALAALAGCGSVGSNSPPATASGTESTVASPTATESSGGTDAGGTTETDTTTGDGEGTNGGGGTGTPTPEPVFTIEDFAATETETGDLKVTVTAKNVSDELATRLIVVEVTVGSGSSASTYQGSEDLTLGPGDTGSFNVVFDVSYQEFDQEGGIRIEIY